MFSKLLGIGVVHHNTELRTESTVSGWNSSVNVLPGFSTLQFSDKSKIYCTDWEKQRKHSQEEQHQSCRCSTTFLVEQETMNKNVWQTLDSYLCTEGDLVFDNGHLLVLVLKRSGSLSVKTVHKECGTNIVEKMLVEFAESGCPIFRATTPLSRGQLKSKGHGAADQETIETFSHNCFWKPAQSLRMCEECESFHKTTGDLL